MDEWRACMTGRDETVACRFLFIYTLPTPPHHNRAELAAVRAREEALRALNPDDPQAAALFLAAVGGGGDGGDLTKEEAGALRLQRGGGREEGGLRMPARKRLVFSRLPSVLCFHLGRRVRVFFVCVFFLGGVGSRSG